MFEKISNFELIRSCVCNFCLQNDIYCWNHIGKYYLDETAFIYIYINQVIIKQGINKILVFICMIWFINFHIESQVSNLIFKINCLFDWGFFEVFLFVFFLWVCLTLEVEVSFWRDAFRLRWRSNSCVRLS